MSKKDDWLGKTYKKLKKPRYMMATKAMHLLGDISRDKPDLCIVSGETSKSYVGNWVTGYGMVMVKFNKKTTKPLNKKQIDYWKNRVIQIGNQPPYPAIDMEYVY